MSVWRRLSASFQAPKVPSIHCRVTAPTKDELRSTFFGQESANVSANQTGVVTNAAHLAQLVAAGYNKGEWGPVSVVPARLRTGDSVQDVHLVTISGTELVQDQKTGRTQATDWLSNMLLGYGAENDALVNARAAVMQQVPQGAKLVLTGHSQGGMVAQRLAADPDIQRNYEVINTITFGAPLVALGLREGEVRRVAAFGDPVPYLSTTSNFEDIWSTLGQQNIPSRFTGNNIFRGREVHANDYTDEQNTENQRMDALGRRDPAVRSSLEFDPTQRHFLSSPVNKYPHLKPPRFFVDAFWPAKKSEDAT